MNRKFRDIGKKEVLDAVGEMMHEKLHCSGSICDKYSVYDAIETEWEKAQG